MGDEVLRIHHFLPFSHANGPGGRAVVWVQGCTLGCLGCFNPETHSLEGGEDVSIPDLFDRIVALGDTIEGITVSGGEPLQQRPSLLALLRRVRRETALSVLIFTGYTWEEIQQMPDVELLLKCIDVLIAGRYDAAQRFAPENKKQLLRSSTNQTTHTLTDRYTLVDLCSVPPAEIIITAEGKVAVSGVDPLRW
ncbi:MAG: radical SAM protein [Chloroflexi bacterium]|nr:radical SAM protein [Chloroflexota bacterium]